MSRSVKQAHEMKNSDWKKPTDSEDPSIFRMKILLDETSLPIVHEAMDRAQGSFGRELTA